MLYNAGHIRRWSEVEKAIDAAMRGDFTNFIAIADPDQFQRSAFFNFASLRLCQNIRMMGNNMAAIK